MRCIRCVHLSGLFFSKSAQNLSQTFQLLLFRFRQRTLTTFSKNFSDSLFNFSDSLRNCRSRRNIFTGSRCRLLRHIRYSRFFRLLRLLSGAARCYRPYRNRLRRISSPTATGIRLVLVMKDYAFYLYTVLINLSIHNQIVNIILALRYGEAKRIYGRIIGISCYPVIYLLNGVMEYSWLGKGNRCKISVPLSRQFYRTAVCRAAYRHRLSTGLFRV